MSPKLTQEQPEAILANLRQELQIGFDQADAGDVANWDIEEILAEAHRRHKAWTS